MDDNDFIRSLSDDRRAIEGAAYARHLLKTSGVVEVVKSLPLPDPSTVAGSLIMAGLGYRAFRPREGGDSREQEWSKKHLEKVETSRKEREGSGRDASFSEGVSEATADALKRLADVGAKHPAHAAAAVGLLAGPIVAAPIRAAANLLKSRKP